MSRRPRRVVIVGGGFGGLGAPKALEGASCEVVLVDRANYHLFQPLLYQVAMAGLSPADIASPIRGILAAQKNARVVLGTVQSVDLERREVSVDGEVLPYDHLVLAVGARTTYFGHDGWEAHAPGLKSLEDALEIRRRVLLAFERAELATDEGERARQLCFVVIGGGPTGVELAGAVAELARYVLSRDFRSIDPRSARVVLVEAGPRILPSFPAELSQSAVEQLAELGVEVRTGARVTAIDERGVELERADPSRQDARKSERVAASTVVWGAGVSANPLAQALGVPIDRAGRVEVLDDCSLPGHPEVFAIGDMARFEQDGQPLPGVSPVAMQQARYVAKLVRRSLSAGGEDRGPRAPFRYVDKGSMATIGRSRAIAWAGKVQMNGFLAWVAWLVVHLWYLISFRNRVFVLLSWAWSYLAYARGARLITATGWASEGAALPEPAAAPEAAAVPEPEAAVSPQAPRSSA